MKTLFRSILFLVVIFHSLVAIATTVLVYFGTDYILIAADGKRQFDNQYKQDSAVTDSACKIHIKNGTAYSLVGITGTQNVKYEPRAIIDSCLSKYSYDKSPEIIKTKLIEMYQYIADHSTYLDGKYKDLKEGKGSFLVQIALVNKDVKDLRVDFIDIFISNIAGKPNVIGKVFPTELKDNQRTIRQLGYSLPGLETDIKNVEKSKVQGALNDAIFQISDIHKSAVSKCINMVEIKSKSIKMIQNKSCN